MAVPMVRWATGVVGCRMGVAYTPIPLEMMCFALGGHGYESLFRLSLCEVGVDVVGDVGCVRVWVVVCEGLCLALRCVAGVVERSAWPATKGAVQCKKEWWSG